MGGRARHGLAVLIALAAGARAQTGAARAADEPVWTMSWGSMATDPKRDPDFVYQVVEGYLDLRRGDVRIRADRAVLVFDRDEFDAIGRVLESDDPLPHRDVLPPFTQEGILASRVRRQLESRAKALGVARGERPVEIPRGKERLYALLVRAIHAEGNVLFEHRGFRHLRCSKLWLSLIADRAVMEDVELRMPLGSALLRKETSFVLRSPRVVQRGGRLVAREARITTCTAGEPHFELTSARVTVTQHPTVTEFLGQGNRLRVAGLPALPLPDYRYFSDQENWIPLKRIHVGTSDERGEFVLATFGARWNDIGQGLAELFGYRGEPFRGEWWLRTGYMRKRGVPFEGGFSYDLPGVLRGAVDGMYLDDKGSDRRSVQRHFDGSEFSRANRVFARSSNRIPLREDTRVDVELFWADDPGVYPEFKSRGLKDGEQPETSVHVRHARDNRRLSATGRVSLVDFAYDERATLAERFRSERPYVRADLFTQPLFEVVEDWPIVLNASAGGGRLRNQFDGRAPAARREASWRGDIELELSAPHAIGPFAVQPFFTARQVWYSDTASPTADDMRTVLEAGALVTTRLTRQFDVQSEALGLRGLLHEVRPEVRGYHRFLADGKPADYFQFDAVDALGEMSVIDVIVLNRLQTLRKDALGDTALADVVWLDLGQRIHPNSTRDNAGHRLGLFSWELIVRPGLPWMPIPNLRFLFEGERDWSRNDFRTRNIGVAAGVPGGPYGAVEWRSGRDGDGHGSFIAGTTVLGRWNLLGAWIYDFANEELAATTLSLERRDHDWSFVIGLTHDENSNDTSFRVQFVPTLGGLLQPYEPRYVGGDPAFGVRNTGNF